MARGMPSFVALLGMLAVAGYNNREKLAELVGYIRRYADESSGSGAAGTNSPTGLDSVLDGLRGLLDRFEGSDEQETARSWVGDKPNMDIDRNQLERVLGRETVEKLISLTGLDHDELLDRLRKDVPRAVDEFSPDGRLG